MKKTNKRGLLRIAEAAIAILIVVSFLILAQVRNNQASVVDFSERVYDVLEEIAKEPGLRNETFNENNFDENGFAMPDSALFLFIKERIPESYLTIEVRVCNDIDKICSLEKFIEGEIYTGQRVIVPSIEEGDEFKAKKLAIFAYRGK